MNDAATEARRLLWEWMAELSDHDPRQRPWKTEYMTGMVIAAERCGVLDAAEIAAWRRLIDGAPPPRAHGSRDAIERHLQTLLDATPPLSRDPGRDALAAWRRFHAALKALHETGLLDEDEHERWRRLGIASEAPWLGDDEVEDLAGCGLYAIGVPPATAEEAAADAQAQREYEQMARCGALSRVFVAPTVTRHDGLAIVAVAARADCTELLFHHVGEPPADGMLGLLAFDDAVEVLAAPQLRDDAGTAYIPVAERPVSASGAGGMAGPELPAVITGAWRYQPSAPANAAVFTARRGSARWTLVDSAP